MIVPVIPSAKLIKQLVSGCSGVLLSGGDDIDPSLYRKQLRPELRRTLSPISRERDQFEKLLVKEVLSQKRPLLAICRGLQFVNVALGGSLIVDLPIERPSEVRHNQLDRKDGAAHPVSLKRGSQLARIFRKEVLNVNSTHHQAVGRVADPFEVTATSADGIVEALELRKEHEGLLPYFMAVQFHPERLAGKDPGFQTLFTRFVKACKAVKGAYA